MPAEVIGQEPCPKIGFSYEAERQRNAVLFGSPYRVPELRFRFLDLATGKATTPSLVKLFYIWDEIRGGELDEGIERFDCYPPGHEYTIPASLLSG